MQSLFEKYIQSISAKFSHYETSEMGYRADFEILLKGIFESVKMLPRIDHDAKAREGNKPDFVVLKGDVPILYLEAKDIGVSLDKVEKSEQMARYYGYTNLVLTDYVEFRFYRNGIRYEEPIKIAEYDLKSRFSPARIWPRLWVVGRKESEIMCASLWPHPRIKTPSLSKCIKQYKSF